MIDLSSLTFDGLKQVITELGYPVYRAKQIYKWISRGVLDFDCMVDLPKDLRAFLTQNFTMATLHVRRRYEDTTDHTVKYVFELNDGYLIETVVMHYHYGNSVCISSQAGCRMGCKFCASTLRGKQRDLTAGEMFAQVAFAKADYDITHVVVMGVGEPLDNYDNLLIFLENLHHPAGLNISHRNVSVSTCGLVDKIDLLADKKLQITLSVSLHAPNDEIRDKIMPVNKIWNVEQLIASCKQYIEKTGRRISFEYTLIKGVNDTMLHARQLSALLKGMLAHINLIPVNYVPERGMKPSSKSAVQTFYKKLGSYGLHVTVRRTLGKNINASCGQLRLVEDKNGVVR